MRASVRRHHRIARPAADVWDIVGRPELVHLWFPGIADCRVEGDCREVTLDSGLTMDERILANDPVQRRFQYALTGAMFREHLATLDVVDLGDGTSLALYAHDADPSTMALVLGGAAGGALAELAHQLETGTGPAVTAALGPDPGAR